MPKPIAQRARASPTAGRNRGPARHRRHQWHNWFDHRNEGTLRIGLRRYPDDAEDPGGKKPIWETYRDAGTDREEESFAPFLSVIGIPDWNILQPVAD